MFKRITLILVILFLLGAGVSRAEVPKLINYQGRITDAQGAPLTGSYSVTFRIYDAASGGNMLWEETHSGVVVNKGLFNVLLGSVANLDIPFDKPYFLEIKVGSEVMSPRQQIAASAYAMRAVAADKTKDADTVMGAGVNATPEAGKICPLDANAKLPKSVVPNLFGAWETKANNTVYQAPTDGFVIVSIVSNGWDSSCNSTGYTDGTNPPTTVRGCASTNQTTEARFNNTRNSFCMPVRKGDYWKVVYTTKQGSATQTIYWISLGN